MPELPAMENFRQLVDDHALGRAIGSLSVGKGKVVKASVEDLTKALVGAKLTATRRYGKFVFVQSSCGSWLAFHCGLTGYFEIHDNHTDGEKAKLLLKFADGGALAFFEPRMFGSVRLIDSPDNFIVGQGLGPDAGAISKQEFTDALAKSGLPLKGFFLEQSILAGIGNVYADEILFRQKLPPSTKAKTLDPKEAASLYKAMGDVLAMATERKASLDNWDMLPDSWLARHRAVGAVCPRCGGAIADNKIAGRHGYFCPACQAEAD